MSTATVQDKVATSASGRAGIEMMTITVRVKRFNPELDSAPRWVDYQVEADPTARILDSLHKIKWEQDGSLTFRRSCAHGVCGSDPVRIHGKNPVGWQGRGEDLHPHKPRT